MRNYSFTDNNPVQGHNYYRLKQKDIDGKYTYSQIRQIEIITRGKMFTVTPNPVSGKLLTIQHRLPVGNTELQITDMAGRRMIKKSIVANKGVTIECNVHKLIPGTYILQIIQKGRLIGTSRFIKE